MKKYNLFFALGAVTLIGFVLRMYNLDGPCLNDDETFTMRMAASNISYIMTVAWTVEPNPPLYYLIAHYIGAVTLCAVRFPAAIFGTLAIVATYFVGEEYRGEWLGILSSGTMAISYNMIYFSQFGRAYTLAMLSLAIAATAFLKLCRTDKTIWYMLFVIFCAISMWSHAYTTVPIGLMCIFLLYHNARKISGWIVLLAFWCFPYALYLNINRPPGEWGGSIIDVVIALPFDLLWIPGIVLLPIIIWTLIKNAGAVVTKPRVYLTAVGLITALSVVVVSLLTPVFPRYAIPVAPLLLVSGLIPVADYIHGLEAREQQVSVAAVWFFVVFACSYTPLIAWYNGCV